MDFSLILWLLLGCFAGIFTGLAPGIHINTIAAFATTLEEGPGIGLALMIAGMSITHCFLDFVPSILFGAPEEASFLSVLPGHRMLLKGKGLQAIKLASTGALFSGIIAIASLPLFFLFIEKAGDFVSKIIPFALFFVLFLMVSGEKGMEKKTWAITAILLSGALGIIALRGSAVQDSLLVCITGFFGSATIIESLRKKTCFPEQKTKEIAVKKSTALKGSILGFLAGSIVILFPAIGTNQAAFVLKKFLGKISTKKFLVLLGGSGTANMILGFAALFAWNKTRNGSAAAISLLVDLTAQNQLLIFAACLFALGFGYIAAMKIGKFFVKKMQKIDYAKINWVILGVLCLLVVFFSNFAGIIAFATATAIGLICVSKGIKRTNCMAFLMFPALLFYLGF